MTETSTSPRPPGKPWISFTLLRVRKDFRSRKLVVATLLLACAYATFAMICDDTCAAYDEQADRPHCRFAVWSSSVLTSRFSSSVDVLSATSPTAAPADHGARRPTSMDRIVFGIGSSAESWEGRSQYIRLWWDPEVTRGFVWVDRSVDSWKEGDPPYKVSEDVAHLQAVHDHHNTAVRISRIVTESFRLGLADVDWFVMGDDDTLFFMDNLVKVLSKYDHQQFHYIGSNSEDSRQSEKHLYNMAFGGGGFAISYPLAKALSESMDECLERYTWLYGSDERVKACVSELGVPLTKEAGFHQLDVHGDISGLLAAHPVSPVVSLHHLDAFDPIFYGSSHLEGAKQLMKAAKVDSASIFQQSICYDEERRWSFSVSSGYVVEVYEGFMTPRELEIPAATFMSWAGTQDSDAFTMDTRPVADVCKRPTRFFMVNARMVGKGSKRLAATTYARRRELEHADCNPKTTPMDTFETIRVENQPILGDWFQSPRRQCCRVTKMQKKFVNVRVGECREGESLTRRRSSSP